jgi:hypothetical protein
MSFPSSQNFSRRSALERRCLCRLSCATNTATTSSRFSRFHFRHHFCSHTVLVHHRHFARRAATSHRRVRLVRKGRGAGTCCARGVFDDFTSCQLKKYSYGKHILAHLEKCMPDSSRVSPPPLRSSIVTIAVFIVCPFFLIAVAVAAPRREQS